MDVKKIAIGCDHAALELKNKVIGYLEGKGIKVRDFGTYTSSSCDYTDIALPVCEEVVAKRADLGILICGTGIGMSIAANKVKGIRAAHCTDTFSAKFTRRHNDANVLCMGARITGEGIALEIVEEFITNDFEGGRHANRVAKITDIESR